MFTYNYYVLNLKVFLDVLLKEIPYYLFSENEIHFIYFLENTQYWEIFTFIFDLDNLIDLSLSAINFLNHLLQDFFYFDFYWVVIDYYQKEIFLEILFYFHREFMLIYCSQLVICFNCYLLMINSLNVSCLDFQNLLNSYLLDKFYQDIFHLKVEVINFIWLNQQLFF